MKARENNSLVRILAVDPGYDRLGIAVVEGDPSRPLLLMSSCVTPPRGTQSERLAVVYDAIRSTIAEYMPNILALETLFFNVNLKTAVGVAEARGAILAAAGRADLRILECAPQQVKLAIAGHGGASKSSVGHMIPRLVTLPDKKRLDDELDAIAIGITALAMARSV